MIKLVNKYTKIVGFSLSIFCLYSCSNSDVYFKDERYEKKIYIISDQNQIFSAEYDMTDTNSVTSTLPFAVSGSNPIDQDVHIEVEKDTTLLGKYNYSNYMDETDKYALELNHDDYSLPTTNIVIKANIDPNNEVGKLQVILKNSVLEKLSVDSVYFIPFCIKSANPYEIKTDKGNVLYQIYKKNNFASQRKITYYSSVGYINDAYFSTSKIVMPLGHNKIRVYVGGQVYTTSDTKKNIAQNAMTIAINSDSTVSIKPYDSSGLLKVEQLVASRDPSDNSGSYAYKNYYNTGEKCFYLYYRYDVGNGWQIVREQLTLESNN